MKQLYKKVQNDGPKNLSFFPPPHHPNPLLVLGIVGNKIDLKDDFEDSIFEEGEEFAKKISAIFGLTSAKEDLGIDELFTNISQRYL